MNLKADWIQIKKHFDKSFSQNLFISLATVDAENIPTVTPIGSLFLNYDQTGFYFEKYPTKLPLNAVINPNICALAVNNSKWFWIKSLYKGKFKISPGIKLYGTLGEKRKASDKEINRLNQRMKLTKGLRGNTYLWKKMDYVREITFTKVETVNLGKMTQ